MQYYTDMWNYILESGISFSTIAVQRGWGSETSYYTNSRQRIFKEIAYSSQGQFYYSPSADEVEESADRIFKQLTSPVEYRLKAELSQTEKKPGAVEVRFEGEATAAARSWTLTADQIAASNEFEQPEPQVQVAESQLTGFRSGSRVTVPPFSMMALRWQLR